MNIQSFFTEKERESINEAVTVAEKGTSAEIVPVLTDASGGYDRAEDTFGVLLALVTVSAIWALFQDVDWDAAWSTTDNPILRYNLLYIVITVVITFIIGSAIASKVWFIRHLFTSRGEMNDCMRRGAERAFHVHNLSKTEGATGILIYISLFERMVYVLGDSTISEKLTDEDFGEVKDAIIKGFKEGKRCDGLCDGIKLCGEKLSKHFPIKEDDVNELSNELIIFEQNL